MTAPTAPPTPEAPAAPAVRTSALTKRYGRAVAVDGLDLEVAAGEVFGLIGPNGAGKTSTFSMLASLLRPTSGEAEVAGTSVREDPVGVRRQVGYMPDIVGVYDDLLVDEYLDFFADAFGIRRRARPALIDGLLELVELADKRTARVDSLSRGMKQRLSLARALVHDPAVLLLDEPASGLDPRARVELWSLVATLQDLGKTVIVSSHILPELATSCDRLGVMAEGRLLAVGTPAELHGRLHGADRSVRVRFRDGSVEHHRVADDEAQERLLADLVAGGRGVLELVEEAHDLEALFLAMTEVGATGTGPADADGGPPSTTEAGP